MTLNFEKISENFLELSSEQRLRIIFLLLEKQANISTMAKQLDATNPEVHRNISRLLKTGLIKKESDGTYSLSNYGKTVCAQIPSLTFGFVHRKFFENHNFGDMPTQFIQRLGSLQENKTIKGYVKVMEKWKGIHKNAKKFIYNILSEVPYDSEIVDVVESTLKNNINIKSIFAENTITPDERKKIFEKKDFGKYIKNELLERKMLKNISIGILLNEKESGVIFPNNEGRPDMEQMFYSTDADFHQWCLDFFNYNWNISGSFQESKLKE